MYINNTMSKKISILIPNKERPNLHSLFHEYIERCGKESHGSMYDYEMMDDEFKTLAAMGFFGGVYPSDEDYDFDDCELVFPHNSNNRRSGMSDEDAYADYWNRQAMKRNARRAARNSRIIEDANYVEIGGKGRKKKHRSGSKKNKVLDITRPYSGWEENPDELGDGLDTPSVLIWFYPDYSNQDDRLEFDSLKEFDDFCCDEGYVVPPYIAEDLAYRRISHTCLNPDAKERGVLEIFAAETYGDMVYEVCNIEELSQ